MTTLFSSSIYVYIFIVYDNICNFNFELYKLNKGTYTIFQYGIVPRLNTPHMCTVLHFMFVKRELNFSKQ